MTPQPELFLFSYVPTALQKLQLFIPTNNTLDRETNCVQILWKFVCCSSERHHANIDQLRKNKNKCEILARSGHTKSDDMKMARPICSLEFIDIGKPVFHHSNGQRNYGIIYFYICRPVNEAYETNDGTRRRDKSKKKKKTRMH